MVYDETLARRIRDLVLDLPGVEEKRMFGGIGFLLNGNMVCGVNKDDLILRLSLEQASAALQQPNVRVFDMTGRPMKGWVVVGSQEVSEASDLRRWVQQGFDFAATLPPK
jgi:TfoX/Sxy family transcriptional regulator of competence genes